MGAPKNTTTTSKTEPWDEAKPYYETLYKQAEGAYKATPKEGYQGELVAGPTSMQQTALQQLQGLAGNQAIGAGQVRQLGMDTLSGKYMDPSTNPYLQGTIKAALNPITDQMNQRILPQINDASISQGAYGGARQGIEQNKAVQDFGRTAADTTSKIAYQNYATERNNQMQAPGLLSTAYGMETAPAKTQLQLGEIERGWAQDQLDAAYQKYQESLSAPWNGIGEWATVLNGGGFNSGSVTSPTGGSRGAGAIQGLLGGGMMGFQGANALGMLSAPALGAAGPTMSALTGTAALGAAMPMMLPLALLGGLAGGLF